jgi:pimeloyl-ACP methyl ester carboxylesterase
MRTRYAVATGASLVLAAHLSVAAAQQAAPVAVDKSLIPYADTKDSVRLSDGRTIHFVCMGKGSPTVILSAGAGDWSGTWSRVQPVIARTTRACAWDRAGFGLSSPPPKPQTITESADDLAAALKRGGIAGPYVLVGHSAGGFESLLLADGQPDEIVGMALVDPAFPDESERLARASPGQVAYIAAFPDTLGQFLRKCAASLRAGTLRKGGPDPDGCLRPHWSASDPPELIAARERMAAESSPQAIASAMDVMADNQLEMLARNSKLTINPARNYGDMPLIVLTRTEFGAPPDYPAAARAEIPAEEAEWNRGHDELAALSTRGVNARVPGAGHDIQHMKPQVVIDAIDQVVREAREGK